MASPFPTSQDTLKEDFTDVTVNATTAAGWQNSVSQAIKQIQAVLGYGATAQLKPQGVYATVAERGFTNEANLSFNGKGYRNHGANANRARPTGFASVEWQGSVAPNNAIDGDTWLDTS